MTSCPQDKTWSTSQVWRGPTLSMWWPVSQGWLTLLAALYSSLQSLLPGEALPDPDMYRLLIFPSVFPPSLDQDFDISTWSPSPSLSSASPCPLKTSATSSYWCGSWEQSGSIMDTWQRHRATAQSVWPSADRPHGQLWLQNERSFHSFSWISQGSKIIWIIP